MTGITVTVGGKTTVVSTDSTAGLNMLEDKFNKSSAITTEEADNTDTFTKTTTTTVVQQVDPDTISQSAKLYGSKAGISKNADGIQNRFKIPKFGTNRELDCPYNIISNLLGIKWEPRSGSISDQFFREFCRLNGLEVPTDNYSNWTNGNKSWDQAYFSGREMVLPVLKQMQTATLCLMQRGKSNFCL